MLAIRLPAAFAKRSASRSDAVILESSSTSVNEPAEAQTEDAAPAVVECDEFKLPPCVSLFIVLFSNVLMQVTFFIIVSSTNEYAKHLGGTSTFSGLVIGIPPAVAVFLLLPMMRFDQTLYKRPLHIMCASQVAGNVIYALAYKANWLYLILIGRLVSGAGFTFFMYVKRYCSDPRIVGVRRRTTLAGFQVLGQGIGFSLGPFAGGLLTKIGFANPVFNGFTAPAWIMAAVFLAFWVVITLFFEDAPRVAVGSAIPLQPRTAPTASDEEKDTPPPTPASQTAPPVPVPGKYHMTKAQWGVAATMCHFSMCNFFILGAWESNIPVFTASKAPQNPFHFTPFAAGNMIALGGVCAIPFLLLNLVIARRVQDRHTLAFGSGIGLVGLLLAMSLLAAKKVSYGSFFAAWFLVALGFNIATTVTLSLLSKQLPGEWNGRISLIIQWSCYTGRVTGAVWGGAGVEVGMLAFVGLQIGLVAIGVVMFLTLWRNLKAKTG